MMKRTFGAPSRARTGTGQAGFDTSNVRPTTPENACPGLYSFMSAFAAPAVSPVAAAIAVVPSRSPRRVSFDSKRSSMAISSRFTQAPTLSCRNQVRLFRHRDPWRCPGPVLQAFIRPVEPQIEIEAAVGRGQPVRFLILVRGFVALEVERQRPVAGSREPRRAATDRIPLDRIFN